MNNLHELENPRKETHSDSGRYELSTEGLSSSTLADIQALNSGGLPEHFAKASHFTFVDSTKTKDKIASENQGQDLDVTVPKGTDITIGGDNCHVDLKVNPKGQMIITAKPGADCDVHFGSTQN